MSGTVVCYDGKPVFNIEGHDLEYSICRLERFLMKKVNWTIKKEYHGYHKDN